MRSPPRTASSPASGCELLLPSRRSAPYTTPSRRTSGRTARPGHPNPGREDDQMGATQLDRHAVGDSQHDGSARPVSAARAATALLLRPDPPADEAAEA